MTSATHDASPDALKRTILRLVSERGPAKSICPSEAAKAASPDDWNRLMPSVRAAAVQLARDGAITILRKGKPVDPDAFKGVYRLSLPREGASGSRE
jgi:hypothetical protein